ncbi:unnamed protein product [Toxocara canis]|uniref:tRNA-intron lyase n=1 Tax=Toxocara canis TaxID=6265 RepID=A0A183VEJ4_TOXCA|nr:unnamed protein product [Toxocara canis]
MLPRQPRDVSANESTKCTGRRELANREMAVQVAKGRKAKQLKRKVVEEGTASARKVRRCDLVDVEVTEEEVEAAFKELILCKEKPPANFDKALIISVESRDDLYEVIEQPPFPDDVSFRRRLCVFRDLWRRGYYLTDGLKFGCDFLLYVNKPSAVHAKYMVQCVDASCSIRPLDMAALSRVASQVNKLILLAVVSFDSPFPYYLQCSWWNS